MRALRIFWLTVAVLAAHAARVEAQESINFPASGLSTVEAPIKSAAPPAVPQSFDEAVERMVESERHRIAEMRNLRPLVETYVQDVQSDGEGNAVPVRDQYFLGRLDLS